MLTCTWICTSFTNGRRCNSSTFTGKGMERGKGHWLKKIKREFSLGEGESTIMQSSFYCFELVSPLKHHPLWYSVLIKIQIQCHIKQKTKFPGFFLPNFIVLYTLWDNLRRWFSNASSKISLSLNQDSCR